MKMQEYLRLKYQNSGICISLFEAKLFGVEYPLQQGWLGLRYNDVTIPMAQSIIDHFTNCKERTKNSNTRNAIVVLNDFISKNHTLAK
jgi:hypothetical protein